MEIFKKVSAFILALIFAPVLVVVSIPVLMLEEMLNIIQVVAHGNKES